MVTSVFTTSASCGPAWSRVAGELRPGDQVLEPPQGPRGDLVNVGLAEAELLGDVRRGEVRGETQRQDLALSRLEPSQPVAHRVLAQELSGGVVARSER